MSALGKSLPAQTPVYIYHGSEDETAPFEHADLYASAIPQAVVRRLMGRDHQFNNDLSEVAADIRLPRMQWARKQCSRSPWVFPMVVRNARWASLLKGLAVRGSRLIQ